MPSVRLSILQYRFFSIVLPFNCHQGGAADVVIKAMLLLHSDPRYVSRAFTLPYLTDFESSVGEFFSKYMMRFLCGAAENNVS